MFNSAPYRVYSKFSIVCADYQDNGFVVTPTFHAEYDHIYPDGFHEHHDSYVEIRVYHKPTDTLITEYITAKDCENVVNYGDFFYPVFLNGIVGRISQ